ncbi:polymorphic toxin-type HINT domain-containing protein [Nonomuraea salmonea]|uniref:Polymorphic toxin-type HINT domain-containing protein n=1 Tax=Nonomuraea salmonea TaxID=46181 RepID=A0ABV5NH76_9ACTN
MKGALPRDGGAWPRTALQDESGSGLPAGTRRAEQKDRATAASTFPLIYDVYPVAGSLVGTTTPLLTVRAERVGVPTDPFSELRFTYHICEVPEEDEDDTGASDPTPPCWNSGALPGAETWQVPANRLEWGKQYNWWVRVVDSESKAVDTSDKQLIAIRPAQPVNGSHLGERIGDQEEFSLVNGNYTTTAVDARVQVAGPALAVVRTYNSSDARTNGIFGAGWSTAWDMKVMAERSGTTVTGLLVTYASGRRVRFAAKGDGTYQPPPGMKDALADVDSGGWRLKDTTSTIYVFNADGRLVRLEDNRGRAQTLNYNTDGTFDTVTGAGGRKLHLTWNGPRVATVSTDPVNGEPQTWTYGYTGDNLTSVCTPLAAPNCTAYTYEDGSRYKGLVLDSEPVGYWRLGDAPNSPAENLGSDGGTGQYTKVTVGQPGALEGSTDTAGGFTQSTMMLPLNLLDHLRDQVTIEGWIKTTKPGVIFSEDDFGGGLGGTRPVLYVGTDGRLRGQLGELVSGGYKPVTSASAVNDDQWHHVVLTVAGEKQRLYLDGQLAGELTGAVFGDRRPYAFVGSGDRASSWSDVPGGTTTRGAWPFQGTIDEFAVYAKPLTDTEVQSHWAARTKVGHDLSQVTLPSGRIWAKNTYDSATDRLLTHTDRHGGLWKLSDSTIDWVKGLYTFTLTDPRGGALDYAYDSLRDEQPAYVTDQAGAQTTFEYDTGGFSIKTTDPNGNVFRRWNDKHGYVIKEKSCRKTGDCQFTHHDYYTNEDDDLDPRNGRRVAFRDARSPDATSDTYATTWEYNASGQQTKQTTPATSDFPDGRSTTIAYTDGSEPAVGGGTTPPGLAKTLTDAEGNVTEFRYDEAGDLAERSDPSGLVTRFTYDELGRLTAQTTISDAEPDGVTTTFTYDAIGRPATATTPGVKNEITGITHTAETSYAYDADGNTLTVIVKDLTGGDAERTITYTYDDHGHQKTMTDPEGGVVTTTWDAFGQQETITDQLGSVFGYTYTPRGELATESLQNWTGSPVDPQPATKIVLNSYSYDPGGRLVAQTDAMRRKTTYTYYGDNLLSQVIADDAKVNPGLTTKDVILESNTYDKAGNLVSRVTGGGTVTTSYSYDAANRLTSATLDPDKLARKTVFAYNANDQTIKETRTGAAGGTRQEITTYAYNAAGILTRQTAENGDQDLTTTWEVDDRGLITATTDPRGNADGASAADYTTTTGYDPLGRAVEVKAPSVTIEKAGTAEQSRPTIRIGYNAAGERTHVIDAEGRLSTSGFDRMGRLTSVTGMPYTPPGGTQLVPKTSYAYDAAGRRITVTNARGQTSTTEYDALGNPVRVTDPPAAAGQPAGQWISEYDLLGEQLATVDPTGARVQATYDDLGRQVTHTVLERKPASAAYVTELHYNDAGYLTRQVQPGGKTTVYTPNAAGEPEKVTDPAQDSVTYAYDLAGRTVKTTNPLGNATVGDYDLAGRLTTVKNLDGTGTPVRTIGLGYDAAGNLIRSTSGEGHVTHRRYDATNLLLELIEPVSDSTSITTSFGYDATGARTRVTDGRGNATWTGYNTLGLIETLTEPATTSHPDLDDRTWTHVYDASGNETALIQPGGVRHDKQYDNLNRLTKISASGAGIVADDKTYTYDLADRPTSVSDQRLEYNDRSLLTKLTPPTGTPTTYAYDSLGNPTQRADVTGTTTYTWDADNRLKTVTDPVSGRTNTYDYDGADRLTTITSANPANTQVFTYDALDRPLTHTLKDSGGGRLAKIAYGWDKDDNLTSKTTEGLAGAGSNTYGYDHAGRLTSWTGPDGSTTTYEWDAAGNRTRAGDKTYTYDERNRLIEGDGNTYTYTPRGTLATQTKNGVTRNLTFDAFDRLINDGDASYTYDAFDRMATRQKSGSTEQRFAYAGLDNDVIAVTGQDGAVQASYGRDPLGNLTSVKEGIAPAAGTFTDLHNDLVGTFTATTLSSTTTYNPFGEVTAQTGSKPALGYQSEYTDPDTGNVNMHARWYQPGTGNFTSRDTWDIAPSPSILGNRYSYGAGSPLLYQDPTGHAPNPRCYRAASIPIVGVPLATICDVFTDARPTASDDVCKDKYGRTAACNPPPPPDKCAEFSNKCPAKPSTNGNEPSTNGKKKNPKTPDRPSSEPQPTNPPRPKNPTDPKKVKDKEDPCEIFCWGRYFPGKNCGKKCMVDGHGPLAPEDDCRIGEPCWWLLPATVAATGLFEAGTFVAAHAGPALVLGATFVATTATETVTSLFTDDPVPADIPTYTSERPPSTVDCNPNSFVTGTRVLLADGSSKAIEDIKVGDRVLATDAATGETEAESVTALITGNGTKHLITITVNVGGTGDVTTDTIIATDHHPFWVPDLHAWIDAGDLQPGMWLRTSAGAYVLVSAVERWTAVRQVHNLTVDDLHTYYVLAGTTPVLVHNDCGTWDHAEDCYCNYEGMPVVPRSQPVRGEPEPAQPVRAEPEPGPEPVADDLTKHAIERLARRQVPEEQARAVLNREPFSYFHEGQWKLGYYHPGSKLFVAKTIDGNINTVMINVDRAYIRRLMDGHHG